MDMKYKETVEKAEGATPIAAAGSMRKRFESDADLFGANSDYLEALYEDFLRDPSSVPAAWAERFSELRGDGGEVSHLEIIKRLTRTAPKPAPSAIRPVEERGAPGVEYPSRTLYLIHAYRVHGHTNANLDPLKLLPPKHSPELELSYFGLGQADLDREFPTWDLVAPPRLPLRQIIDILRDTYCGSIGPEFMHISNSVQKRWLQERLEGMRSTPQFDNDTRRHIYSRIMRAEVFEQFLHTRYVGQKRFSLEGSESLIPLLDAIIQKAGEKGAKEIILGMAHRGRLNVLANILGKSLNDIFAEFEGLQFEDATLGSGDVKYHLGFSSDIHTAGGVVHLSLAFNPSHLEVISPAVEGSVRARQRRRNDVARRQVMSVLVHGDAAFAGQGVVAESMNLSKLSGFKTGGTIHIVVNNQIGFTTNPYDARSTLYCTDIAKTVQAPILHVNGDDPEAVSLCAILAVEFRNLFKQDVVIDLVSYRRHGHNEADEPSVTQPVMYRKIGEHQTVQQIYRQRLIEAAILSDADADHMVEEYRNCLEEIRRAKARQLSPIDSLQGRWEGYYKHDAPEPETAVDKKRLASLVEVAHSVPAGFELHAKVEKIYEARKQMMRGKLPVDWGCAEAMAYATLLDEGHWVRLSGQDTGRGTFFHRHAIVYDQATGKKFVPLRQAERGDLAHFVVVDSMLSELAVMAFEYGYSLAEPRALVIWEAQYGDFANNAQVVIDQFISSSEAKWNRMSGLVLWLPHGYEGQGPEHSSARLERFLQLCAEDNMQVVYPSTPAQLFHLFRRQSLIKMRKPLIMMGPKSLLRQKSSFSSLADFTAGRFEPLLPEADEKIDAARVRRVILCSGKVYYDLLAEREKAGVSDIAILRIERLYPFPSEQLESQMAQYAAAKQVLWVQEEPANQGAWLPINSWIRRCLAPKQKLYCLARPEAAAPAVGSGKRHAEQQRALIESSLGKSADTFIR